MNEGHNTKHVKLLFEVENDDGSVDLESVWAIPVPQGYKLDNVPFYAQGVALEDVVTAELDDGGMLRFTGLSVASGHSTVRLWFGEESHVGKVRDHLRGLGCSSELDLARLVAVDVPPSVPYSKVRAFLDAQEDAGILEYEEACLGQDASWPAEDPA